MTRQRIWFLGGVRYSVFWRFFCFLSVYDAGYWRGNLNSKKCTNTNCAHLSAPNRNSMQKPMGSLPLRLRKHVGIGVFRFTSRSKIFGRVLFFFKLEDNGTAPLLIIYQQTLRATAFWFLRLPQVAGWLRKTLQADTQKQTIFDLLLNKGRGLT
jgi:hypothetical protein